MEIRQLRTFQAVAQMLSFNRAAERLHYAQSSISAQIQALEEELEVKLFDRLGRRILLTEAGERLLQYARKILDLADETKAEIVRSKEPEGALTIRVPESFCVYRLPPMVKQFRSRFPKVSLSFVTCAVENLQKDLRKGITDLAFLLTESIQAADLEAEALGFEHIMLVASPRHPLAAKPEIQTRDLEGETILLSKVDCSYRRSFEQILDQGKIRPGITLEFNSVEAIKQCVMEGIGITILPEVAVAREIAQGRLAALTWGEGKMEVALLMIWYKERWLSPTLSAFIRMARDVYLP
ncbi:MAG: LysR family transcriptional regulator [Deltaproteobacteria bacterium]|nr:LysR family transcriptional regulator [Deltaproteobacteria bacterium]